MLHWNRKGTRFIPEVSFPEHSNHPPFDHPAQPNSTFFKSSVTVCGAHLGCHPQRRLDLLEDPLVAFLLLPQVLFLSKGFTVCRVELVQVRVNSFLGSYSTAFLASSPHCSRSGGNQDENCMAAVSLVSSTVPGTQGALTDAAGG